MKLVILGLLALAFPITLSAYYYITDIIWFITSVGVIMIFLLELFVAMIGSFIIRRQARWGKVIFFWSLFYILGIVGYYVYDAFYAHTDWTFRLLVFGSPALMTLGMVYVKYILDSSKHNSKKSLRILGIFAMASITTCTPYFPLGMHYMSYASIFAAEYLGSGLSDQDVIITGFHWSHPINYFGYPKEYYVLDDNANYLFPIGGNLNWTFFYNLQKTHPGSQIYIILDSSYLKIPIVSIKVGRLGILDIDQVRCYENFPYLNCVQGYWTGDGNWMMTFCLV
ncbi:MAG: hypothetical protein RBG13Loki_2935 [Promethearchaeota archaeon CR_4]|nr:MAG: hypothetical protein RBG13Loki_2935 [Candidatus Lokiarchaeota archaeon CR_4]